MRRFVFARSLLARSLLARSLLARSILARSLLARSILARSLLARSLLARLLKDIPRVLCSGRPEDLLYGPDLGFKVKRRFVLAELDRPTGFLRIDHAIF